jgi:hypothetical protein
LADFRVPGENHAWPADLAGRGGVYILQRDVIARGIFTSTADLARQLRRYTNAYSNAAKLINWKYSNPNRRIPHVAPSSGTVH